MQRFLTRALQLTAAYVQGKGLICAPASIALRSALCRPLPSRRQLKRDRLGCFKSGFGFMDEDSAQRVISQACRLRFSPQLDWRAGAGTIPEVFGNRSPPPHPPIARPSTSAPSSNSPAFVPSSPARKLSASAPSKRTASGRL